MKGAKGFFGRMAAAALGCGLAAAAWGQSTDPGFQSVIRIFKGQQTARLVENATSARVMDGSLATVAPDGDTRLLLTGLKPGRTVLTHTRKDGTPVAEQVVVMPPLSANALEVYGLVADIPGINVYEVQERTVIDGRLASGSDVDRVKSIADAMGESVLNLTVLDTGASNDVITDFIKRNAGVDGLTVSIFGDTAYLRGTVASEAVRSNVVALAATQIANVMDMLTVQTGMIETEVVFLRVENSKGHDWGMNLFGGSTDVLGLNAGLSGSQNYAENVWSTPQIAVSWSASLAPAINALVSGGQAEVVARPRIGTRIGETGRFLSGGEMYYKTAGEISGDLDSVEYGIELTVAPQYLLDRQLCNNIKINLSYPVAQSGSADLSLDKYTIESTVVCEVGQSIVISGLTEHINELQNEKTPLLGHIPVLRLFFSHRQRTTKDSELVAIITPRVLGQELSEAREDGASEAVHAERAKLEAKDAEAAARAQEEHVLAQRMVEASIAQAEADGAKAERRAMEEEIKAKREAEKEREKAEKLKAKEREREERRLEQEKAKRLEAAKKRKAKREAEKAAKAKAEELEKAAKAKEEERERAEKAKQEEREKAAKAKEEAREQKALQKEKEKQERLAAEEAAKAEREAEKKRIAEEKERRKAEKLQEEERKKAEKLQEEERKKAEKLQEEERKRLEKEKAKQLAAKKEAKAKREAEKAAKAKAEERERAEKAKQEEREKAAKAKEEARAQKALQKEKEKQERLAAKEAAKAAKEAAKAEREAEKKRIAEEKERKKEEAKLQAEARKQEELLRKQEEAARRAAEKEAQTEQKVQKTTEEILAREIELLEQKEAEIAKEQEKAAKKAEKSAKKAKE